MDHVVFLTKIVDAWWMEHVVSNNLVSFVRLLNKGKTHILYIEGGKMDKRFISEKIVG